MGYARGPVDPDARNEDHMVDRQMIEQTLCHSTHGRVCSPLQCFGGSVSRHSIPLTVECFDTVHKDEIRESGVMDGRHDERT